MRANKGAKAHRRQENSVEKQDPNEDLANLLESSSCKFLVEFHSLRRFKTIIRRVM